MPGFIVRNGGVSVQRVRLVFKAHGLVYHSTLGWRVITKKKKYSTSPVRDSPPPAAPSSLLLSSLELSGTKVYEP